MMEKGEIWYANLLQEDGTRKLRPCLILNKTNGRRVIAPITSVKDGIPLTDGGFFEIKNLDSAGLAVPSLVDFRHITNVSKDCFVTNSGNLSLEDSFEFINSFNYFFSMPQSIPILSAKIIEKTDRETNLLRVTVKGLHNLHRYFAGEGVSVKYTDNDNTVIFIETKLLSLAEEKDVFNFLKGCNFMSVNNMIELLKA